MATTGPITVHLETETKTIGNAFRADVLMQAFAAVGWPLKIEIGQSSPTPIVLTITSSIGEYRVAGDSICEALETAADWLKLSQSAAGTPEPDNEPR